MISVVIPVYNGAKYISRAIRSIQETGFDDLEIVVVNDGSTDESISIIDELAAADSRIKVFSKENGGIASSRTFGLYKATGEYVCFMDQDDIVMPDIYRILLRDIETSGADFAQGQVGHIVDDRIIDVCEDDVMYVYEKGSADYSENVKYIVWRGWSESPTVPLIVRAGIYMNLFRRSFLIDRGIRVRNYCDYEDDWVFGVETLCAANRVCVNTKTLYLWRIHEESTLHYVAKDRYIENLYDKFCAFREYMYSSLVNHSQISEIEKSEYKQEMARQTLLWCLSNETGRGIENRGISDGVAYMEMVISKEAHSDYLKEPFVISKPLSMSGFGTRGIKYKYHRLRDIILVWLLMHGHITAAVWLNKKVLHGRWHI